MDNGLLSGRSWSAGRTCWGVPYTLSRSSYRMRSIAIPAILTLSLIAISPSAFATVISLGPTNQNVTLTGSGVNAQGQPTGVLTWGTCSYNGTKTTCTVTAPF